MSNWISSSRLIRAPTITEEYCRWVWAGGARRRPRTPAERTLRGFRRPERAARCSRRGGGGSGRRKRRRIAIDRGWSGIACSVGAIFGCVRVVADRLGHGGRNAVRSWRDSGPATCEGWAVATDQQDRLAQYLHDLRYEQRLRGDPPDVVRARERRTIRAPGRSTRFRYATSPRGVRSPQPRPEESLPPPSAPREIDFQLGEQPRHLRNEPGLVLAPVGLVQLR
ncbi:hypothetical protein H4W33_006513 [Kibdelosporangium phytohabitans]|nr:hypothetical protein [Kibdelosporangium phytohabitans]